MIARIQHGWDETSGRKDVREHAAGTKFFPSIAARNIKGYRGAELFIREDDDEMEFVTLLRLIHWTP